MKKFFYIISIKKKRKLVSMDDPYKTPPQSPRKQECPGAPKRKKNKKNENGNNVDNEESLYCDEKMSNFEDKDKPSRSLF